jgi:hypothetical protein
MKMGELAIQNDAGIEAGHGNEDVGKRKVMKA